MNDYSQCSGFPSDFIDEIAAEVAWRRETDIRVTSAVAGITRAETDASAFAYRGQVAATLAVLRDRGVVIATPAPKKMTAADLL